MIRSLLMSDREQFEAIHQEWTRVVDGVTYHSYLRETEPGVYHVSAELMEQMMRELGWEPALGEHSSNPREDG